eukprot:6170020-Pyramimonas_sp.AAC.1
MGEGVEPARQVPLRRLCQEPTALDFFLGRLGGPIERARPILPVSRSLAPRYVFFLVWPDGRRSTPPVLKSAWAA